MAEELLHAKQDNPQKVCGCLNGMISSMEEFWNSKKGFDASLLLQHPGLLRFSIMSLNQIKKLNESKHSGWEPSLYDMLMLRDTELKFRTICIHIFDTFREILEQYGGWLIGDWADKKTMECYERLGCGEGDKELNVDYLIGTNAESLVARGKMHSALCRIERVEINNLLHAKDLLSAICPGTVDIAKCFEATERNYSKELYKRTQRDLKHEAQKYKPSRSASLTPEIWGELMENEDKALELAVKGKLVDSEDEHFDAFTEDMRKGMENSYDLMQKIINVSSDDNLFDFEYAAEGHVRFYDALNQDNVDLALELILRHNLIRCETFPDLRLQYENWLNPEKTVETMSETDKAILGRLLEYVRNCDWQSPATDKNVSKWMRTLFGCNDEELEPIDVESAKLFRDFFKSGRGGGNDRVEISMANILGFLMRYQLIVGGQQQISTSVFGSNDQKGNINKGRDGNASKAFENLESFMTKYLEKIIVKQVQNSIKIAF